LLTDNFFNTENGKLVEFYNASETVYFDEDKVDEKFSSINYISDSVLHSLRRQQNYIDINELQQKPSEGFDWLFYYRKGAIYNIKMAKDEYGNILKIEPANEKVDGKFVISDECAKSSDDAKSLAVFGDIIESIECDNNTKEITFKYIIGAHLTATYDGNKTDSVDEDITYYYWKDYTIDTDSPYSGYGLYYTETFTYETDSDLDKLVNETLSESIEWGDLHSSSIAVSSSEITFDNYINGKLDSILSQYKFEFRTGNNTITNEKLVNDYTIKYNLISSDNISIKRNIFDINDIILNNTQTGFIPDEVDGNEYIRNAGNIQITDYVREDIYQGITYQPDIDTDINIQRGLTSVFEKHLRFGEVKTLEDMENFQNSSFFGFEKNETF